MKRILRSRTKLQKFQSGGAPQMMSPEQEQMMMQEQQMQQMQQQPTQGATQEQQAMPSAVLVDQDNNPIDEYNDQLAVESYSMLEKSIYEELAKSGADEQTAMEMTGFITDFISKASSEVYQTGKQPSLDEVRNVIMEQTGFDIGSIQGIEQLYGGLTGFMYLTENPFDPSLRVAQTEAPSQYRSGGFVRKSNRTVKNIYRSLYEPGRKSGTNYFRDIAKSIK